MLLLWIEPLKKESSALAGNLLFPQHLFLPWIRPASSWGEQTLYWAVIANNPESKNQKKFANLTIGQHNQSNKVTVVCFIIWQMKNFTLAIISLPQNRISETLFTGQMINDSNKEEVIWSDPWQHGWVGNIIPRLKSISSTTLLLRWQDLAYIDFDRNID